MNLQKNTVAVIFNTGMCHILNQTL